MGAVITRIEVVSPALNWLTNVVLFGPARLAVRFTNYFC